MYVLADKYDIGSLGDLAKKKFDELANNCRLPSYSTFPVLDMIPRIYAITGEHNRGIRDAVVEYARLDRSRMGISNTWTNKIEISDAFTTQIESLFESVPEFAVDISCSWLEMPCLSYCDAKDCGKILREQSLTCTPCGKYERNGPGDPRWEVPRAWSTGE